MAILRGLSSSSHPRILLTSPAQISKSTLIHTASNPITHKWNIAQYDSFTVKGELHVKHTQKLKEVSHLLNNIEDQFEGLIMIDTLQRLGIDYRFQEELEAILWRQYMKFGTDGFPKHDLYEVSTRFRLLRQAGHYVQADGFNNLKDKNGKFKSTLREDIWGLMGLYEASQLSIQGEDILDEAADFSSQLLKSWMKRIDSYQAKLIRKTLSEPYHKSLATFTAKSFLDDFKSPYKWMNDLQELAKMDCEMVRSIHQKEIIKISKWWKEIGLSKELKFVRSQPLKWYMWTTVILDDPTMSDQRVKLTKALSLIYIIDDVFDVYGNLDELVLFTDAVNKWDFAAVEQLPDYMKTCFKALYESTNEISCSVYKAHGLNPMDSLRKAWASLCNAFLVEAKWFASGQLPKAQEYLNTGVISSGVHTGLVHTFYLLGQDLTKESVDLVDENPEIISSTAMILRLWDDLGSAKDENQYGNDGSYIRCYMKENQGTSFESARNHVFDRISNAWKRLNRECLSPSPFSATFRKSCLSVARMVSLMYSYDDNHSLPILEEYMKLMLHDGNGGGEVVE